MESWFSIPFGFNHLRRRIIRLVTPSRNIPRVGPDHGGPVAPGRVPKLDRNLRKIRRVLSAFSRVKL